MLVLAPNSRAKSNLFDLISGVRKPIFQAIARTISVTVNDVVEIPPTTTTFNNTVTVFDFLTHLNGGATTASNLHSSGWDVSVINSNSSQNTTVQLFDGPGVPFGAADTTGMVPQRSGLLHNCFGWAEIFTDGA